MARYKSLSQVEQAFRNFKSASLELRPVHHKTDDRIRSHVFLCMLAYYLQWHMMQRLEPLFAEQEQGIKSGELERKDRRWTLCSVLECLKAVRRNDASAGGVKFQQVNELTADQQKLLELLRVKFPRAK